MSSAVKSSPSASRAKPSIQTVQTYEDDDSPPSLTHSSESPRSTGDEGAPGGSRFAGSAPAFQPFLAPNKTELSPNAASFTCRMPDGNFASASAMAGERNAGPPAQGEASTSNWVAGLSEWQYRPRRGSDPSSASGQGDNNVNDDDIFAALIQEGSYEDGAAGGVASASSSDHSSGHAGYPLSSFASVASNDTTSFTDVTPPQSSHLPISQDSSRRSSAEGVASSSVKGFARIPHSGSHYSHTSDADLPSSSRVVVRPAIDESLSALAVHVHGIAEHGAKSRVETQIRLRLDLVRAAQAGLSSEAFERIGSFRHIKLPPLTGTKRKSKKHRPTDIDREKTLYMDVAVVCAQEGYKRVFVCKGCQQRERKRAQRRKTGARGENGRTGGDEEFSVQDMIDLGVNPEAPDAQAQARVCMELQDGRRAVVFNCGDYVAFEEGTCILPTRITCYCRHHEEKTGFHLVFTMRNCHGQVIATGNTPPIMITDDHKSVGAAANNARMKRGEVPLASTSRAQSTELQSPSGPQRVVNGAANGRRRQRSKPYGDADERQGTRRNTTSSSTSARVNGTSTGNTTPSFATSPSATSAAYQPDFWNPFVAPDMQGSSGITPQVAPPDDLARMALDTSSPPINDAVAASSAAAFPSSAQNGAPAPVDAIPRWLESAAVQGSLSPQTLQVDPSSLPGFNMQAFIESIQRSQAQGDGAMLQSLMMAAQSLPPTSLSHFGNTSLMGPQSTQVQQPQTPAPIISKLIPGDGPTSGGIEVTVLGENFEAGQTCFFGDVPATSTKVWGSNTLLCMLPPTASPGPVAVTVKNTDVFEQAAGDGQFSRSLQLFTYTDASDRALMELALQVVGYQTTGQMQSAREVAMKLVRDGRDANTRGSGSSSGGRQYSSSPQDAVSRDAIVDVLSSTAVGSQSFQDTVIDFLRILDVDLESDGLRSPQRADAIRLANKQGHTLLHLSVILGFHRLASELIRRNCPVNARDHTGMTALHFCALRGRVTLARMLLSHGALDAVENDKGQTPLDIAFEQDQPDIEALLGEIDETEAEDDVSQADSDAEGFAADSEGSESLSESEQRSEIGQSLPSVRDARTSVSPDKVADTPEKTASTVPEKVGLSKGNEEKSEKTSEKGGLKALVAGSIDLASRARYGVPTALHESFGQFHVPAISVFQMAHMPSFADRDGLQSTASEHSARIRTSSRLKEIAKESALWIYPLSEPPTPAAHEAPPAYDSLAVWSKSTRPAKSHHRQSSGDMTITPRTESPPAGSDTSARQGKSSAVKGRSSRTKSNPTATSVSPTRGDLRDDRMLVYFWLPILLIVILSLCLAKPSSILSLEDFRSFIPVA